MVAISPLGCGGVVLKELNLLGVAFYILAFGVVGSGIMVISALNPIHSIFWLVVVFTGSAVFFL